LIVQRFRAGWKKAHIAAETGLADRSSRPHSMPTRTRRYERSRHGELVHMDVKKLGRIPDGGGWRAYGLTGYG
jgi:hypothetical protein